jgi:BirA family biotin operon repressor/biotin-[acetyl-CoA-carboxylase] ligase
MAKIFENRKVIKLKEVDSTNIYAGRLSGDTPDGTVVWADVQLNGRGLGKNSWEGADGQNLTFSIKVYPTFLKAVQQFYLSKIVSLSVADFIFLYTANVSVKWPNDIYCNDKKIAGILIENSIEKDYIKESVIGIGININQKKFISEAPNPVSLNQLTNIEYDLHELLDVFISIFDYRYKMLQDNEYETIDENYLDRLYRKGIFAEFIAEGQRFTGKITGVDATGELSITDESGKITRFLYKEVEYLI